MKIILDKKNNMLNIQFSEEVSTESAQLEEGLVVDYNSNGRIINIEIEDASDFDFSKLSFETIEEKQKLG